MNRGQIIFGLITFVALLNSPAVADHASHRHLPNPLGIECRSLVRFSPHGGVAAAIAEELDRATSRIRVGLYGLNHPDLVAALLRARGRRVSVVSKLDKLQSAGRGHRVAIQSLRDAEAAVEVSELSRLVQNKFAVIDGRRVITGSFNWTTQAENRHRENVVILYCEELGRPYEEEWEEIASEAP